MKAVFSLFLLIIFAAGIWTAFVARPLLQPFVSVASDEGMEARFLSEDTPGARWVRGIVRYIDPGTGTVLLQTEKGTVELFAPPQVLLSLTEGETVSAYIAADELATTVAL